MRFYYVHPGKLKSYLSLSPLFDASKVTAAPAGDAGAMRSGAVYFCLAGARGAPAPAAEQIERRGAAAEAAVVTPPFAFAKYNHLIMLLN